MVFSSGIGAQCMFGAETTWATPVTPDHSPEFNSESIQLAKGLLQGMGLRGGGLLPRASRRIVSTRSISGNVTLDCATRGLGLLWKHGMGSAVAAPTALTAPAFKQIHQIGSTDGYGMTWQIGSPQTNGTVQPFTYNGVKIVDLEFSVSDGQIAQMVCTLDGQNEVTATALATYAPVATNSVFNFSQANVFKLGGTASTTTGVVSIATGVAVSSIVKGFTLKITRGVAASRFGLGNGGLKAQQVINNYYSITGTMSTEFTNRAEMYDLFSADTGTAIQLTLTGAAIGASGSNDTLDIVIPVAKFDTGALDVAGADIIPLTIGFTVLDDGTNNPLQVTLINADAAL